MWGGDGVGVGRGVGLGLDKGCVMEELGRRDEIGVVVEMRVAAPWRGREPEGIAVQSESWRG